MARGGFSKNGHRVERGVPDSVCQRERAAWRGSGGFVKHCQAAVRGLYRRNWARNLECIHETPGKQRLATERVRGALLRAPSSPMRVQYASASIVPGGVPLAR